jgi:ABC-type transport system involved in cytochrome bd biosynthesis fused ATPase/permease subunit
MSDPEAQAQEGEHGALELVDVCVYPAGGPEPVEEVELAWSDLTVTSTRNKAKLLDNLTGRVGPGFTAIMGPSGAGKSTLLNVLACRMDKGATLEGKVRLNGQTYELAHLKRIVSSSAPAPPSVTV